MPVLQHVNAGLEGVDSAIRNVAPRRCVQQTPDDALHPAVARLAADAGITSHTKMPVDLHRWDLEVEAVQARLALAARVAEEVEEARPCEASRQSTSIANVTPSDQSPIESQTYVTQDGKACSLCASRFLTFHALSYLQRVLVEEFATEP